MLLRASCPSLLLLLVRSLWYVTIRGGGNLLSFLLRCGTRPYERGNPMRLELTRVGLLVELANHYTIRGGGSFRISSKDADFGCESRSGCFMKYELFTHSCLKIRSRKSHIDTDRLENMTFFIISASQKWVYGTGYDFGLFLLYNRWLLIWIHQGWAIKRTSRTTTFALLNLGDQKETYYFSF